MEFYNSANLFRDTDLLDGCLRGRSDRTRAQIADTVISDRGILFGGEFVPRERVRRYFVENKTSAPILGYFARKYDYLYMDTGGSRRVLLAISTISFHSLQQCIEELRVQSNLFSPFNVILPHISFINDFEKWLQTPEMALDLDVFYREPEDIIETCKKIFDRAPNERARAGALAAGKIIEFQI